MANGKAVLVTTRKGVFFGYLKGEISPEKITLIDCRMVVRWVGSHGVQGLAKDGPGDRCRVSPAAPQTEIIGTREMPITMVSECTDQAVSRFEAAPWG
jgi:hypothetical protein